MGIDDSQFAFGGKKQGRDGKLRESLEIGNRDGSGSGNKGIVFG